MLTAGTAGPHPDIELGAERATLRYWAAAPKGGIDRDTGLILFITGYGMDPGGSYVESLLPYLASRHNCLAASVEYFGATVWSRAKYVPFPDFFARFAEHYGITITVPRDISMGLVLTQIADLLAQNGQDKLHGDCRVGVIADEYNGMGFLPALDNLQITHRLVGEHGLNRKRLFVIGTSYGGYIASLMAKLAPETFRMVVDNSGFSSADDDLGSVAGGSRIVLGGVGMTAFTVRRWSFDPAAPNYFSPARREIRSLFEARHVRPNTARLYAYHSATDTIAPIEPKLRLRQVYEGHAAYDLRVIDASALDGRVFKTLDHGMKASMRGLFDLSYEKYLAAGGALADHTDFDLEREIVFPCTGEDYVLRYSRRDGVTAALSSKAAAAA
jgi:pimeloyl-ACP methyl ester carboxylesterase